MWCIEQALTCAHQSTWATALHLVHVASNNVLLVSLLVAYMAARWADGYQRRSKVKEFQFEIYKAMTTNYTDCVLQSIRLREAKAQEKIETEKRRLDELANAGVAMHLQIGSLFEENVSTPWFKVNGFFRAYAADPINTDFSLINQTMEHAADALAAASVQAWLPFKRTKLTTDLAVKHSGKEPTK